MNRFFSLLFILLCGLEPVQAEVYSWTDEKGVRHFSDNAEPGAPPVDVKIHGKVWANSLGMEFVYLNPGTFKMGTEPAGAHTVKLTQGFQIQVKEVTIEQWSKVVPKDLIAKNKELQEINQANMPVCNVTAFESHYFVSELNKLQDGGRYHIPTEAQWEYACRAGETSGYNWGGDLAYPNLANYMEPENRRPKLKPVGSYAPNRWFIYDMHGNVWEWCQEVAHSPNNATDPKPIRLQVQTAESDSHAQILGETNLILRGGGYNSPAHQCRAGYRVYRSQLISAGCCIGLRVIRVPED